MTDLTTVVPGFPIEQHGRVLAAIEKKHITTADLLTLDCIEIAQRAGVSVLDAKRLSAAILEALRQNLGIGPQQDGTIPGQTLLRRSGTELAQSWQMISTLDERLDKALGGGIPTRYITEVTGESGAGKTQLLLTLLLSAQLPLPYGLSSHTLYISTESALPTSRLAQLLSSHPRLMSATSRPSLDKVISIVTPDLESQDHILRYQVPVAIRRYGIRLLILDSVAANYRAEFERPKDAGREGTQKTKPAANMAQRSSELVKLGQLLRDLAQENDLAVVVANQVADRFSSHEGAQASPTGCRVLENHQVSPLAQRSRGVPPPSSLLGPSFSLPISTSPLTGMTLDPMSLDHQQRFFTGWGDDPNPDSSTVQSLKTPSLGLIWTTQIACRIALIKSPVYAEGEQAEEGERPELVLRRWRRWLKVVFAPHVAESGMGVKGGVEFEIKGSGIVSLGGGTDKADEEEGGGEGEEVVSEDPKMTP